MRLRLGHPVVILTGWICLLGPLSASNAARIEASELRRRFAIEHMRIAASDRLIEQDDEIAAYSAARFNTLVLYDADDSLPKSEERIAYEIDFARRHGMHVVVGKPADALPDAHAAARAMALPPLRHSFGAAAMSSVPDDEIRERLLLWDRYGHDIILGVFFLYDDAFYIHVSAERQRHLYALAHATVPEWCVFGMIGEFGFEASAEEVERYFDPQAFDHLLVLMFPLNLGSVTGMPLDQVNSADPDGDMRSYVRHYIAEMGDKFIKRLRPSQLAILVIQSFAYHGEPAGHVPRAADVAIQATLGNELLQSMDGQKRNHTVAYFLWDGSRSGMSGLWQRLDWMDAAQAANEATGGKLDELTTAVAP